jgi:NAD(P)-dependent dehydrogenase (short-subunit alcohol dehydrogenase family)
MDKNWTIEKIPDLTGKIIIITGANSGIGFESTRSLAAKGARIILASRNPEKAKNAIRLIKNDVPSARLDFIELNLSNLKSVHQFADNFKSKYKTLDILLNNAGVMLMPYGLTDDGFENTFGTNHLGHFALTGLLLETISKTPGSRVVTVSSNAHYGIEMDFDNLMFDQGIDYTPMDAYRRSKLANLLFTYELQRRFISEGIAATALASHPGISATQLADHRFPKKMYWLIRPLMRILLQSSAMGALPSLRAATDPQASGGEYYGQDGAGERSGFPVLVDSNSTSKDLDSARRLWEISQELTGVKYL